MSKIKLNDNKQTNKQTNNPTNKQTNKNGLESTQFYSDWVLCFALFLFVCLFLFCFVLFCFVLFCFGFGWLVGCLFFRKMVITV